MGSADVVPGVSGGTIALVLGIYEQLIENIRLGSSALGALIKGDLESFRANLGAVEWGFLLSLLAGILTAVLSLAHFIADQLARNPIVLAAAFFGLVVGSIAVATRLIRHRHPGHFVVIGLVGILIFVVLGLGSSGELSRNQGALAFFGSGALAICAMILPGISGSLILVLIGMYDTVLGAVNDRDLLLVGAFIAGAVVGLAFFSQILHVALRQAHDMVLAVLIGLMVGSLRIVWPWPDGVSGALLGPPDVQKLPASIAGLIGLAFVIVIARWSEQRE